MTNFAITQNRPSDKRITDLIAAHGQVWTLKGFIEKVSGMENVYAVAGECVCENTRGINHPHGIPVTVWFNSHEVTIREGSVPAPVESSNVTYVLPVEEATTV